jgi:hypothetical protein
LATEVRASAIKVEPQHRPRMARERRSPTFMPTGASRC